MSVFFLFFVALTPIFKRENDLKIAPNLRTSHLLPQKWPAYAMRQRHKNFLALEP